MPRADNAGPIADVPISTLLSQLLVAFTIEFDNEAERQIAASGFRPWLVSMVMWSDCLQFVTGDGVRAGDLPALARIGRKSMQTCLAGVTRWGYAVVRPDPAGTTPAPPKRDWLVELTPAGRVAAGIWRPLFSTIEQRWEERFGKRTVRALRGSLTALVTRFGAGLPDYLPVLGYGLELPVPAEGIPSTAHGRGREAAAAHLPSLLSQVLHAFTIDFERESDLSLAMTADVVRVIGRQGTRVRDLPRLGGVSKEAIAMAVGYLTRRGYGRVDPDPAAPRAKVITLTPKGQRARASSLRLIDGTERRWEERFGPAAMRSLRDSLAAFVDPPGSRRVRLAEGLMPPPRGWRGRRPYVTQTNAMINDPWGSLPHYPMVLHRGGYPDGS